MLFSRASLRAQSPAKALRSHLSSSIIVLCSPFGAAAGFGRLLRPAGRGAPPPKSGTAGRRGFFRGKGKKRGEAPGLSRMIKSSCAVPARGIVRQCLKKFVCGTAPRTGRSGKKSGGPGVRKSAEGKRKIRAFRHRERPGRHSARPSERPGIMKKAQKITAGCVTPGRVEAAAFLWERGAVHFFILVLLLSPCQGI